MLCTIRVMGVAGSLFWDLLKMLGYFPNGKSTNLETYIYIYMYIYIIIIIITTIIIVTIIYIYSCCLFFGGFLKQIRCHKVYSLALLSLHRLCRDAFIAYQRGVSCETCHGGLGPGIGGVTPKTVMNYPTM